eukprot:508103-Prymnesium_polylepis.1
MHCRGDRRGGRRNRGLGHRGGLGRRACCCWCGRDRCSGLEIRETCFGRGCGLDRACRSCGLDRACRSCGRRCGLDRCGGHGLRVDSA